MRKLKIIFDDFFHFNKNGNAFSRAKRSKSAIENGANVLLCDAPRKLTRFRGALSAARSPRSTFVNSLRNRTVFLPFASFQIRAPSPSTGNK